MDRYGRKVALATPLIPMIVLWIITANATSFAMLFASRILIGIIGGFGPPICQVSSWVSWVSYLLKFTQSIK